MTLITNEEKIVNDVTELLKKSKSNLEKIIMECIDLKDNLDLEKLTYLGFRAENQDVKNCILELCKELITIKDAE